MPSRAQLELRARVVGVTTTNYPNDSALEQRVIYEEKAASTVAGALATGTITSDATNPSDGDTATIGSYVYTFKTALGDAAATNTLTSNNTQVTAADTVTVNGQVYTFRATPSVAYDVTIGANADGSLTNLEAAINGTGTAGTTYGVGTATHPTVSSSDVASHVLTLTARNVGTAGNALTLAKSAATLSVGAATFSGGASSPNQVLIGTAATDTLDNLKSAVNGTAGAGTTYGSGTPTNRDVTAGTKTATTIVFTATNASVTNAPTTETSAHLSFGGATLTGGSPTHGAAATGAVAAESGGAQV